MVAGLVQDAFGVDWVDFLLNFCYALQSEDSKQIIINILHLSLRPPEMSERKIWKQQDDQILKQLFEVRKIRKWSEISRIMHEQFGIPARNGKQCRERYHNHLRRGINKEKWTAQEENFLIELHAKYGNRWALISKHIDGRTENCVKNMLYSKLRKAIRQLNRFVFLYYRKEIKEIKLNFIYRLIEFTENAYKREEDERNEMELIAIRLKNQILRVEVEEGRQLTEDEKSRVKGLIQEIHTFKRKNQRFRGNLSGAGKNKAKIVKKDPSVAIAEEEGEAEVKTGAMVEIETQNRCTQEEKERVNAQNIKPLSNLISIRTSSMMSNNQEEKHRSKLGFPKMDSLESNFSFHFVEAGLEMPIQIDQQFVQLNPTGIFEEWGDLGNPWINNFYY